MSQDRAVEADAEPDWKAKFEEAVRAEVPLGCERKPVLSRICERGTECCGVHHAAEARPADPLPQPEIGSVEHHLRRLEELAKLYRHGDISERLAMLRVALFLAAPAEPQADDIGTHIDMLFRHYGSAEAIIRAVLNSTRPPEPPEKAST